MVRKILDFLYQETNSLNQAALLLGVFSFLSQFLGFLRDRLLAHIFGASAQLDVYYAAFRIPDFLFVTVASIVSLSVLIPFIIEKDSSSREELRRFIDSIFSFFGLLILTVSLLTYILMPWLSGILFKGLSTSDLSQVIFLSRLLLLSPIILGFSNLLGSLTQAYNRFTLYAVAPILYNAGIVMGVIILAPRFGILGVAIGVIIGAFLHLLIQVPFIVRAELTPRPTFALNWNLIERVVKISLPRTLTLSMSSIVFIYLTALAARMVDGSVSLLAFSNDIQTISLSLVGVSYSLAAFPTLSRKFQEKDLDAFVKQMQTSARFIIFWSLPLTALLVVLRAQIVRVLLGSGAFGWTATRITAAAVALFIISSVFQSLILLFMRGFYSAGFTKKPFFINLFSTIALIFLTRELVQLFYNSNTFHFFITALLKVEDLPGNVMIMLPLGFSLGSIINGLLLWVFFEREFKGFSRGVVRALFEGIGTSFIMGLSSYIGLQFFQNYFDLNTLVGIFLQGFLSGVIGIGVGIIVLIALKSAELMSVWEVLRGRFYKVPAVATDPEIV